MNKLMLFTMLVAVLVVFGATGVQAGTKVQICHIPPGNPDNFHTITISENAFSAHLAHGDLGRPCNALCATICDDGNACTIDDSGDCEQVGCPTDPAPVDCNDQNTCTDDTCDSETGCVNTPLTGAACDDGQFCSGPDTCDATGVCQGPAIDTCCLGDEDCSQNPCDQASCNLDTNQCDEDPVVCTPPDLCTVSECSADTRACVESAVVCDPGETCNPATGDCALPAQVMTFTPDRDTANLGTATHFNLNFGGSPHLAVGNFGGADERSVLSFDVSALSGQFSSIDAITLRLVVQRDVASVNTLTYRVFAISASNRDWTEGIATSGGVGTVTGDSTWGERHLGKTPGVDGTPWAGSPGPGTAGTDYDSTLFASRTFTAVPDNLPNVGDVIDFTFTGSSAELTSLINTWLVDNVTNSLSNPGLLLLDPNGPSLNHAERVVVFSRESGSALRPQLIVTYTP